LRKLSRSIGKRERIIIEITIFAIKFSLFSIPIYIIKFFNLNLFYFEQLYAFILSYLLNIMSVSAQVFYTLSPETLTTIPAIHVKDLNLSFGIDNSCTGYISMLALTGLILSTPRRKLRKKFSFLAIGLVILFLANILRILITILFALNFGEIYLDVVHNFLWREALIIIVVILWIIFLKLSR